tara:strand:+ start:2337 stop:4742 length:2406 start_codon:yes stop_codon:yes gene_type:complete
MKFSLSWLKEYLETDLDVYKIADLLTNIGLEVENIEDRSKELKPFTVAYVKKADKHPNADRLKVCEVETKNGTFQVVCGAPNARKGMKGVFAPEGSFIPGTKIILKKTSIREVDSAGMLVSEKEMGISEEHEGIIEVDNKYKVGESFAKIFGLNDPIIEIGITPNRGDCLSVIGISRDLAAAGAGKFKSQKIPQIKGSFDSSIKWKRFFNKKNEFLCPAVAGVFFKKIKNSESPEWLKRRLLTIGLRPISTLVDITNYITYDLGRPLHVFDADKINGNLTMRLAKKNESIKALDGKIYNLNEEMVIIADEKQPHAIGGIMGGEESSCNENTTNVFLEVALFDPISIARTGRKLDLQSDARYRFERGIDPNSIEWGINKACQMILELCGGEASKITVAGNYKIPNKKISYNFNKISTLGGIAINKKDQKKILESLGFKVLSESVNKSIVVVPSYRPDIDGEADLVEEVLRIFGYDKIQPKSVKKETSDLFPSINSKQFTFYKFKRLIASRGYFEVVTWSFMSSKLSNYFNNNSDVLKIDNPISNDLDIMRPSIIPNLLESINKNQARFFNDAGIFEVGPQYQNYTIEGQKMVATGIKYGNINGNNWIDEKRSVDVFDIKSDIYFFLSSLGISTENLQLEDQAPDWYHPGKSCSIKLGKINIGYLGEINPIILNLLEIKSNVCAFEVFVENLGQFLSNRTSIKKPFDNNPYQIVERDFAFILDKKVRSNLIIESIKRTNKELIKDVTIFDVFEGKTIPEGKKSVAAKVIFQPKKSTFTDKDIEDLSKKVIEQVCMKTGAFIRE